MKKTLTILLSLLMIITAFPLTAFAELYDGNYKNIYMDQDGLIEIITDFNSYEVEFAANSYMECQSSPGITNIADVFVPDNLYIIHDDCFSYCSSPAGFRVYDSKYSSLYYDDINNYPSAEKRIENISTHMNYGVCWPSGLGTIGDRAFAGAEFPLDGSLPNKLRSIGESAFEACRGLYDVILPDSVTYIGYRAFAGSALSSITLGNGLTSFSMSTISETKVSELTLPESISNLHLDEDNKYSGYGGSSINERIIKVENANCSIDGVDDSDLAYTVYYHKNTQTEANLKQFVQEHSNRNITLISFEGDDPVHEHSWSEWVYNNDAVDEHNGTRTRTCSECGESETVEAPNTAELKRSGNALALEDSVALKTYVDKATVDYYDEVYAEFERNGKITRAELSTDTLTYEDNEYAVFDFSNISPQAMDDEINITVYGIKDGVTYNGESYKYSVTEYINRTLDTTDDAKLKTMLVDLLYYGAECQIYSGYKTDSLMTDNLTDEEKTYKSEGELELVNIKNSSYETCENRLVRFGTALRLNNSVEIATALNISNITIDDLTFKVKAGDRSEQTFTKAENPNNFEFTNGYWYFYYDELFADQFSDEVYITAYYNDEPVSYTLKYSVESYAASVTDENLKSLTDAMMRYGNSAKAYSNQ